MRSEFIDICRGIAILSVILHHTFYFYVVGREPIPSRSYFAFDWNLFNNGWLGVNLFFILSGLVLYRPNMVQSGQSIRKYYFARIKRLIPLYFLVIVGVCIWEGKTIKFLIKSLVGLLTGVHDLIPKYWMPEDVLWVFWSLGVEILFSWFLPVLILAISRIGFWRVFWAVVVGCFIYRAIGDYWFLSQHVNYGSKFINPIKDNLIGRLDDFLFGMAAAKWMWEKKKLPIHIVLLSVVGIFFCLHSWNWIASVPRTPYVSVFVSSLHIVFAASSLCLLVSLSTWPGWNSRWFLPLSVAGVTCYSSYVVHGLIIQYLPSGFEYSNPLHLLLYFLAIVMGTLISFLLIECWGMKTVPWWAERILGRKKMGMDEASKTKVENSAVIPKT